MKLHEQCEKWGVSELVLSLVRTIKDQSINLKGTYLPFNIEKTYLFQRFEERW